MELVELDLMALTTTQLGMAHLVMEVEMEMEVDEVEVLEV